jgi:hypothetical protein
MVNPFLKGLHPFFIQVSKNRPDHCRVFDAGITTALIASFDIDVA